MSSRARSRVSDNTDATGLCGRSVAVRFYRPLFLTFLVRWYIGMCFFVFVFLEGETGQSSKSFCQMWYFPTPALERSTKTIWCDPFWFSCMKECLFEVIKLPVRMIWCISKHVSAILMAPSLIVMPRQFTILQDIWISPCFQLRRF